jgi:hypothetical protein
MANTNITAVTAIYGKTTYLTPQVATPVVLLANAAGSANTCKINQIVASNIHSTNAINASLWIYTNGAQSQNSVPTSGVSHCVANAISVPVNASLIIVDKTTAIYLEEGTSIVVSSGTANGITYSLSYELIS